jgi:O-methyltransferase
VAGTARGWGLLCGELEAFLENDPLYQASINLTRGATFLKPNLLKNLFMILKYGIKNREGDIVEFGSYHCGAAMFIAKLAQELGYQGTIYALDTFEGIPQDNREIDFHQKGDFNDLCFEKLTATINHYGLTNLVLVRGLFDETLPRLFPILKKVILTHIDCDVEAATRYAILSIEKKMDARGYMIIDDVHNPACLGVTQAVEETLQKRGFRAEQAHPHFVYRVPKLSAEDAERV